jgi:hypothetical protein
MRSFALLLGIVFGTTAAHAQGTAVVSGVARDEAGAPIREVLVSIDPDSLALRTRTGADGSYRITVPTGRYEVRVVRIGYRPQSQTITVTAPATELDFVLQAVSIRLDTVVVRTTRPGLFGTVVTRGIALLPHESRALRGARIEAVNTPHNVRTGADGRFNMPQLPAGAHGVMISLDGYVTRLVPVSITPDGGLEMTVVLDSLYAEYQRWDEDALRGITGRQHRAISPATFISQHEIDPEAKNLRDGIRYSNSLLSHGVVIRSGLGAPGDTICVYVNGKPRPDVFLQDIDPVDVEALEVYPRHTLIENVGLPLPPFPRGSDCEKLWMVPPAQVGNRGSTQGGSLFPAPRRTMRAAMGNAILTLVVWTRGRR